MEKQLSYRGKHGTGSLWPKITLESETPVPVSMETGVKEQCV